MIAHYGMAPFGYLKVSSEAVFSRFQMLAARVEKRCFPTAIHQQPSIAFPEERFGILLQLLQHLIKTARGARSLTGSVRR